MRGAARAIVLALFAAAGRVGHALVGHYVLFTERPDVEPGTHRIEIELLRQQGIVLARSSYVE